MLYAPVVVLFLSHPLNPMRRAGSADVARHREDLAAGLTAALATSGRAATGREVIDDAQKRNGFSTWRDRTLDVTTESYTKTLQRTRDATITEQTDPRGEHRTFMEFTGPADVTGTLFLHLSPRGDKDQQWLWTPAARRARRLADAQRDENFMGTDLSYRDLELIVRIQQWNDDESTASLLPEEAIDGKTCQVVELVPKNNEFSYAKYRLWFGKDDALLEQVEVYDSDAKVMKRMRLRDYQRIQNYATARDAEVSNLQHETRTRFKINNVRYDTNVDESVFTVSNIQKGR
jgi:outer membrane lipoprotein-sorting protein